MKFYGSIFSMIDFPGELGLTVFTKGCNLRCPICHNPSLVIPPPNIETIAISVDDVIKIIDDKWITGLCITGGEPTIHADLQDTIERIKHEKGVRIKLDTNGVDPMARLPKLLSSGLVDLVAMDVKAPMDSRMDKVTGKVNSDEYVDLSVKILKESGVDYHFRTVCFERFLSPEDIGDIAEYLAPCKDYMLLPFDPHDTLDPELQKDPASSSRYMESCLREARKHVPGAHIVGNK